MLLLHSSAYYHPETQQPLGCLIEPTEHEIAYTLTVNIKLRIITQMESDFHGWLILHFACNQMESLMESITFGAKSNINFGVHVHHCMGGLDLMIEVCGLETY